MNQDDVLNLPVVLVAVVRHSQTHVDLTVLNQGEAKKEIKESKMIWKPFQP
jgi:hypothetical protein